MTAYTGLVLGLMKMQDIVYKSFFHLDENYVQYNFCYVYILQQKLSLEHVTLFLSVLKLANHFKDLFYILTTYSSVHLN